MVAVAFNQSQSTLTESGEYPVTTIVTEVESRTARAKHLPLHLGNVRPLTTESTAEPAPGLPLSGDVDGARRCSAHILSELMRVANLNSADIGAALNVPAKRVREMTAGDRPFYFDHFLLVMKRIKRARPVAAEILRALLEDR